MNRFGFKASTNVNSTESTINKDDPVKKSLSKSKLKRRYTTNSSKLFKQIDMNASSNHILNDDEFQVDKSSFNDIMNNKQKKSSIKKPNRRFTTSGLIPPKVLTKVNKAVEEAFRCDSTSKNEIFNDKTLSNKTNTRRFTTSGIATPSLKSRMGSNDFRSMKKELEEEFLIDEESLQEIQNENRPPSSPLPCSTNRLSTLKKSGRKSCIPTSSNLSRPSRIASGRKSMFVKSTSSLSKQNTTSNTTTTGKTTKKKKKKTLSVNTKMKSKTLKKSTSSILSKKKSTPVSTSSLKSLSSSTTSLKSKYMSKNSTADRKSLAEQVKNKITPKNSEHDNTERESFMNKFTNWMSKRKENKSNEMTSKPDQSHKRMLSKSHSKKTSCIITDEPIMEMNIDDDDATSNHQHQDDKNLISPQTPQAKVAKAILDRINRYSPKPDKTQSYFDDQKNVEMENLKKDLMVKKNEIEKMNKTIQDYRINLVAKDGKINSFQKEIEQYKENTRVLEEENNQYKEKVDVLANENTQYKITLQELQIKNKELVSNKKELEEENLCLQDNILELENINTNLKVELDKVQKKINNRYQPQLATIPQSPNLKQSVISEEVEKQLREELKQTKLLIKEKEKVISNGEETIVNKEKQLKSLQNEMDQYHREEAKHKRQVEKLKKQINTVKKQLEEAKNESAKWKRELEFEQRLHAATQQIQEAEPPVSVPKVQNSPPKETTKGSTSNKTSSTFKSFFDNAATNSNDVNDSFEVNHEAQNLLYSDKTEAHQFQSHFTTRPYCALSTTIKSRKYNTLNSSLNSNRRQTGVFASYFSQQTPSQQLSSNLDQPSVRRFSMCPQPQNTAQCILITGLSPLQQKNSQYIRSVCSRYVTSGNIVEVNCIDKGVYVKFSNMHDASNVCSNIQNIFRNTFGTVKAVFTDVRR